MDKSSQVPVPVSGGGLSPPDLAADSGRARAAVLAITERFSQDKHAAIAMSARIQKAFLAGCQVAGTHSTDPEAGLKGFQAAVFALCEDMDWAAFNARFARQEAESG